MGPSVFIDGQDHPSQPGEVVSPQLQWGRRSSSTDRKSSTALSDPSDGASCKVQTPSGQGATITENATVDLKTDQATLIECTRKGREVQYGKVKSMVYPESVISIKTDGGFLQMYVPELDQPEVPISVLDGLAREILRLQRDLTSAKKDLDAAVDRERQRITEVDRKALKANEAVMLRVKRPSVNPGTYCLDADANNRERVQTVDCRPAVAEQAWELVRK